MFDNNIDSSPENTAKPAPQYLKKKKVDPIMQKQQSSTLQISPAKDLVIDPLNLDQSHNLLDSIL